MSFLEPISLTGQHGALAPLDLIHHDDLAAAVQDGELWKLWYTNIPTPGNMRREIERRLQLREQGSMLPFAVLENSTGRAVGMTTYMNIDAVNRRVEIGGTWYRRRVQRSGLNTECKLMLLTRAFEQCGAIAVEFRTHLFNRQSRAGIERLGARLDGVLRQHQITANGTLRDTCVYSIISSEWPTVKTHLSYQLSRPRA
jgi:RimJ/RimL family protein N-acetyltransferase